MVSLVDEMVQQGVLCEGPEGWEISGGSQAGTVVVPENLRPHRCPTKNLHR